MFEIGTIYRRRDLHHEIGGQRQGGISTPRDFAGVLLFTGASGEKYGYSDGWSAGVFRYTGEGQRGDMAFVRGNRAVRDHGENRRDLYLFAIETSGCRYLGPFACGGWSRERAPDGTGALRSAIVFDLIPLTPGLPDVSTGPASNTPISERRRRALAASAAVAESQDSTRVQTFRSRSRDVADYVLARAAGRCEACGREAPFVRSDASPFLETHHIRRLADGGPDHPRWVAGVCPNCHRRAHYGADLVEFNDCLETRIAALEQV